MLEVSLGRSEASSHKSSGLRLGGSFPQPRADQDAPGRFLTPVALCYLDASALFKRYKTERGSNVIDHLMHGSRGHRFVTSVIASIEIPGVVTRMLKNKELTLAAADALLDQVRFDMGSLKDSL